MISKEYTIQKFGYSPDDLAPQSHKKVIRICEDCGKLTILSKQQAQKPYCISCCKRGSRNPFFNRRHTIETKNKISRANTGNIGYWKGKTRSEETKLKVSATKRGTKLSKEHRRKISLALSGKKCANWRGGITPLIRLIR